MIFLANFQTIKHSTSPLALFCLLALKLYIRRDFWRTAASVSRLIAFCSFSKSSLINLGSFVVLWWKTKSLYIFVSQNAWLAKKLAFPYCIRDLLKLIKIFKVFNNIELYKNVSVKQMKNLLICDIISMQSHAECSTQLLAIFNFSSSDFLLINAFLFESACLTAH